MILVGYLHARNFLPIFLKKKIDNNKKMEIEGGKSYVNNIVILLGFNSDLPF